MARSYRTEQRDETSADRFLLPQAKKVIGASIANTDLRTTKNNAQAGVLANKSDTHGGGDFGMPTNNSSVHTVSGKGIMAGLKEFGDDLTDFSKDPIGETIDSFTEMTDGQKVAGVTSVVAGPVLGAVGGFIGSGIDVASENEGFDKFGGEKLGFGDFVSGALNNLSFGQLGTSVRDAAAVNKQASPDFDISSGIKEGLSRSERESQSQKDQANIDKAKAAAQAASASRGVSSGGWGDFGGPGDSGGPSDTSGGVMGGEDV